jgi:hypothetical protein
VTELPPQPDTVLGPPPPGTPKKKWPRSTKIAIGVVGAVLVLGVIGALVTEREPSDERGGGSSSSDSTDALTERTCEIFRDISRDAANGVDNLSETRDRFRDLLNGYGEAAPTDIASALQDVVAALTDLDTDALESAVGRLDDACLSRGL